MVSVPDMFSPLHFPDVVDFGADMYTYTQNYIHSFIPIECPPVRSVNAFSSWLSIFFYGRKFLIRSSS